MILYPRIDTFGRLSVINTDDDVSLSKTWFQLIKIFFTPRFGQAFLELASVTSCIFFSFHYPRVGTFILVGLLLLLEI